MRTAFKFSPFKIPNGTPERFDSRKRFLENSTDEGDLETDYSETDLKKTTKKRKRALQRNGVEDAKTTEHRQPNLTEKFRSKIPAENFDSIGGMEEAKELVTRQLLHLLHPEIYPTIGIKPPSGILLTGPSGTGKTLLAKAACGQHNLEMIEVNTTELISDRSGNGGNSIKFKKYIVLYSFL